MAKKKAKKKAQSKTQRRATTSGGARKSAKSSAKRSAAKKPKAKQAEPAPKPMVGSIVWRDLTVKQADKVCAFYSKVVGWDVMPLDMGGYSDYCMLPPGSDAPEAGVCHARGVNAGLPSQWLMYVVVADLDKSLKQCAKLGGTQIGETRPQGANRFAVVRDPAGAVLGLYEVG